MGYGRITDEPAGTVAPAPVKVTLYTALGCPFCPLIEQRLETLRKTAGFTLENYTRRKKAEPMKQQCHISMIYVKAVKLRGRPRKTMVCPTVEESVRYRRWRCKGACSSAW